MARLEVSYAMTSVLSSFAVTITHVLFIVDPAEVKVYSKPHAQNKAGCKELSGVYKNNLPVFNGSNILLVFYLFKYMNM